MRRAHREKLIDLEPFERKVWQMTERMNRRGVALDMPSVKLASDYVESHESVLKAEFVKLTGCLPKSPVKVAEFFGIPDARKPTIRDALRDPRTSAEHKHGLRLLQKLAGSARSKLDAMQARVNADGRLRGALVYAGSERTLRWSSWGVQLQNMRRGLGKGTDLAFMSLALDILDLVYDGSTERPPPDPALDPLSLVGEMMRGFLIGPFKVADLAQIECRVLAWLAGQDDLLEAFRNHGDPYCDLASKIYGEAITKADKMARFLGKQATLAAGYGQGFKRFRAMLDEVYDVQIDEAFAKRVINVYRQSNQKIVALWSTLERGMLYAIESNANRVRVGPVFMGVRMIAKDKFAYIELPSRRRIWYAHPEIKVEGNHNEIRYFGRDIFRGGAWGRVSTFGGKIAENLSQATSRDLLAAAMLRLDAAGYKLNLTVHDEVVVEDDDAHSLEEFKAVFEQAPEWAAGLPLDSDCFSAYRYQK
jgi:DNA polymerase